MKNKTSYMVTPNFYTIYCNGVVIKTNFNLKKVGTAENFKKAHEESEALKWGIHRSKKIQERFDAVLNK